MLKHAQTMQTPASTISSSVLEATADVPHPRYPNRLRAWIKQEGYTFREIAAEMGIPESTLYEWAAGRRPIPHQMRARFAGLFGCTVEDVIPEQMPVSTLLSDGKAHLAQELIQQAVALLSPCSSEDIHQLVNHVLMAQETLDSHVAFRASRGGGQ
jgi:transcriptional regulator with XRE-family HTH domain